MGVKQREERYEGSLRYNVMRRGDLVALPIPWRELLEASLTVDLSASVLVVRSLYVSSF